MKTVHFVMQGKGGAGKTFTTSILAQYLSQKTGNPIHCFDTDPVNKSFSQMAALNVSLINILTDKGEVDPRQFDPLIEKIVTQDGIGVIDNGATTFIPLLAYLKENGAVDFLNESGITVYVHVPLLGGQAFSDTLLGLSKVLKSFNSHTVVWFNNYQGQVVKDARAFQEMGVYKSNKGLICGLVDIADRTKDTFGVDIRSMTSQNLTFDEVAKSDQFFIMSKQRIVMFKRSIFEQLDAINLGGEENDVSVEKNKHA